MSYSIQRVTSDGTLTDVIVGLEYMVQSDINVYVDTVLADGTRDYSYVWVNPNTIRISPVVPVGLEVLVARATFIEEMLHDYEAGAVFNPKSMDENFTQLLYSLQEGRERTDITDVYNDINMHNHKVYNLALATNDFDAIPYKQYKDDALGAAQAKEDAEEAADRAEAAANASGAANQLATCVATIEEPSKVVWWKGKQGIKEGLFMYSTNPGQPDVVLTTDGNIGGWAGAWKPTCSWTVTPASTGRWTTTHDLSNFLMAAGIHNSLYRSTYAGADDGRSNGITLYDNISAVRPCISFKSTWGDFELAAYKAGSHNGLNLYVGNNAGMDYAEYAIRLETSGRIYGESLVTSGDVYAFNTARYQRQPIADIVNGVADTGDASNVWLDIDGNPITDTTVPNIWPNATTLEANPLEFGLVDIVEKLSEVIVNLKVKVEALEGALDAIRNPVV
jgi:hypothetical protein